MAAVLVVLGTRAILKHRSSTLWISILVVAVFFGLLALVAPRVLRPLNKAWFHLGRAMGAVVSPIVLGTIFFGILAPVSLVTRLFGRDVLRLKRHASPSYWIDRAPPDLARDSFKNQF